MRRTLTSLPVPPVLRTGGTFGKLAAAALTAALGSPLAARAQNLPALETSAQAAAAARRGEAAEGSARGSGWNGSRGEAAAAASASARPGEATPPGPIPAAAPLEPSAPSPTAAAPITMNSGQGGAVPAGMPPKVDVLSPSAKLTPKETHAVTLARRFAFRPVMPHPGPDGVVRFPFGATTPTIVCAAYRACDLELQPGEIVNDAQAGDDVQWHFHWFSETTESGLVPHVSVKPDDAGLRTNLIIHTTRRTYNVSLASTRNDYTPLVGFSYAEDDNAKSLAAYRSSVERYEGAHYHVAAGGDLEFYRISPPSGGPSWRPVRAYTDGQRTIIEFPRTIRFQTAPVLVALVGGGLFSSPARQVVNYHPEGDRYVADGVLDRAALIEGVGTSEQKVLIERERRR